MRSKFCGNKYFSVGVIAFLMLLISACSSSSSSSTENTSATADTYTPVIVVHGSGGGMSNYSNVYSYFSGMGFPEERLFKTILPRIGMGNNAQDEVTRQKYAAYLPHAGDSYDRSEYVDAGSTAYNVPYLKGFIDNVLTQTGAAKVDLICHSNGTAVTRLFLQDATYAAKVRKVIFVGGFADVNGDDGTDPTYGSNSYLIYLRDVTLTLPSGIDYYAVDGTADSDRNLWKSGFYLVGIDTLFKTADVPGAVNYDLTGYDHWMSMAKDAPVQQMYEWLTGNTASALSPKTTVAIAGTLVDTNLNGTDNWQQVAIAGATVVVGYYDITTGAVTQTSVCSTTTDANGIWACAGLDASKYFRVSYTVSGKTLRYYYADKITQNKKFLDNAFNVSTTNTGLNGYFWVGVRSHAEIFYNQAYYSKPATTLTGWISNDGGLTKITFNDAKTVPSTNSELAPFTLFWNAAGSATYSTNTSTQYGVYYNFWQEANACTTAIAAPCNDQATAPSGNFSYFAGHTVTMEVTLNGTRTVRIQFPGNDSASTIYNWIMFLD